MEKPKRQVINRANLDYVDQSAQSLNLTLLKGAVDSTQFQVLRAANLAGTGLAAPFSIHFAIIGESHLAIINIDKVSVISEVFACGVVPRGDVIIGCPSLNVMPHEISIKTDDYEYSFDLLFLEGHEQGLPRVIEEQIRRINRQADYPNENSKGLVFTFLRGDRDRFDPQTVVVVRIDHFQLIISSLHSYPNEGSLVFTSSIFTPKKKGRHWLEQTRIST